MQVSVSSYYRWLKQPQSPCQLEDEHLSQLMIQLFTESKGRYGAPRLHVALRKLGKCVGRCFIASRDYIQHWGIAHPRNLSKNTR